MKGKFYLPIDLCTGWQVLIEMRALLKVNKYIVMIFLVIVGRIFCLVAQWLEHWINSYSSPHGIKRTFSSFWCDLQLRETSYQITMFEKAFFVDGNFGIHNEIKFYNKLSS